MKILSFLIVFLFSLICSAQNKSDINLWVEENTITSDFNNLLAIEAFKKFENYVLNKKIIALGEPTHGSKEAQLLRLKLFKYLVEHQNFRAIALEATENSGAVNDYLLYGKGSPELAIKAMSMWMYGTEETKELLEWIRNYNSGKKEKVRFYGADLNYTYDFKNFRDSIRNVKEIDIPLIDSISDINDKYLDKKDAAPKEILKKLIGYVNQLNDKIIENKTQIERFNSKEYYSFLTFSLNTYKQAIKWQTLGKDAPKYYRDSCLADNINFISKSFTKNGKVFYGAHNGHIQYDDNNGIKTSGAFLKELLNDEFYNIGIEFGNYTFNALNWSSKDKSYIMKVNSITEYKKTSLSILLFDFNKGAFYIDFQTSPKDKTYKSLFEDVKPIFSIGWLYAPGYENMFIQKNSYSSLYDGLFFIKNSSGTNLFSQKKSK